MKANKATKKTINLIAKILLGLTSIGFLSFKLHQNLHNKDTILLHIKNGLLQKSVNTSMVIIVFGLVFILMIANWGLEAFKWKILITKIQKVNWKLSFKSVFTGIAAGVFTPFKLGSYLGRVVHLPFKNRLLGLVLNFLGNMAQFLVTTLMGLFGLLGLFFFLQEENLNEIALIYQWIIIGVIVVLCFLVYAYLNIGKFAHWFKKTRFTRRWEKYYNLIQRLDATFLGKQLLSVSFIRYLVILTQYVLIFYLLEPSASLVSFALIVPVVLSIAHFLPTLVFLDFGASKAAMYIIIYEFVFNDQSTHYVLTLAMVTFIIWLINIFLPSVLGSVFLFKIKLIKEK